MTRIPRHPGLDPGSISRPAMRVAARAGRLAAPWTPDQVRGEVGSKATAPRLLGLAALLALAACGKAAGLAPATGQQLPVAPRGATATPTPVQLLVATPQQRPQRGDELLRNSQERRDDEFDLPPQ